jgi:hypothetical protein
MEEDPLIPLVHVWSNAAFDNAAASSSAWHAHSPAPASAREGEGDKENHRPEPDVEAEIGHIEAEILRLSSRLHHLRTSQQPQPHKCAEVAPAHEAKAAAARPRPRGHSLGPLDIVAAVNPNLLTTDKQQQQQPRAAQGLKPIKQAPAAARARGFSLAPLDTVAANPRVPSAAAAAPQRKIQGEGGGAWPILRPIKEPPVQRRRGVSLGPLEIHHGVGSKPGATVAAERVKPLSNKLGAVREEGQRSKQHAVPARPWPSSNAKHPLDAKQSTVASRAKARSGSMSPSRLRRQSTSKATETRAGNAKATEARGANATLGDNNVADELTLKCAVADHNRNASTGKRPAGSSKVRIIPSRYSLTPGSSLAAPVTQGKLCKQPLSGSARAASHREEMGAKLTEPSNDELSPESLAKVAELLPRIRTMPPSDESPRDSGCAARRVADLAGKRSFFTAAADDGNPVTPYQARVVELETPETAAAAEA